MKLNFNACGSITIVSQDQWCVPDSLVIYKECDIITFWTVTEYEPQYCCNLTEKEFGLVLFPLRDRLPTFRLRS